MANLLAGVASTLQWSSAGADADMLGLDSGSVRRYSVLAPSSLPFRSLLLTWAAVLTALVPSATQVCLASPHAHGRNNISLVTE
jgi:hypothetical protein